MTKLTRNKLIAHLVNVLIWSLMLAWVLSSGGCTIYEVSRMAPDGSSLTVKVKSSRDFEQPQLHYARAPGTAEFDFGAESAVTRRSPIESSIAGVITSGGQVILGSPVRSDDDQE
jgi:hypothetical protein